MLASPALAQADLSSADRSAAFGAAGFQLQNGEWRSCEDPGTPGYMAGQIDSVADLNADGRPEALLSEGSAYCFGTAGVGYTLVSKQADGSWRRVTSGTGMPTFLESKGTDGWPDVEVGGPGICFPVHRWNGKDYAVHRHQYEGKPCRPQG
jgi:hypothetical protein